MQVISLCNSVEGGHMLLEVERYGRKECVDGSGARRWNVEGSPVDRIRHELCSLAGNRWILTRENRFWKLFADTSSSWRTNDKI